ncbi:MAG: ThuA domain-containing protein [Dehalococcoidia bacterium]
MTIDLPARAHVIAGGFPPGQAAGHDHDYARLRLLQMLDEKGIPASVGNDFNDVERWLAISRVLVTYVAGPYPNDEQNAAIRGWIEEGGHWVGLHGTSGGRAARIGDGRRRAMVKTGHHDTLGGFFINHPPVRKFRVDVANPAHPLARDLPEHFEVIDEPYMIELQHRDDTDVLLTAELGPDVSPTGFGFHYEEDTALEPDGKTRVMGFTRTVGAGKVTYIALGHCHTPATNSQPFVDENVDPEGKTPLLLRDTWEKPAYATLVANAMAAPFEA